MENEFRMLIAPPNRTYRKRLIGEYFYQDGSRFSDTSRAIWNEMRGVNQPDLCGKYTEEVFINVGAYGVDIPSLIDFVRGAKDSNSPYFNWDNYDLDPTCVEKTMVIERGSINYQDCSSNTIQLRYLNEKQELVTSNTIVTLNKRKCYIEPEVSKQWSYVSNINAAEKHVSLDLNIYFEKTAAFRTYETNGNTFNINSKYKAIQFSSENIEDILYLIKDIYGESYISNVKKKFTTYYAEALRNCKVGDQLNFLYKKAPDFVVTALNSLLGEEVLFTHLETLSQFDEASWFDDSSKAIIKLLKSITPAPLYTYFKNNPYQLKRIFYNLDNASNVLDGETKQSNKSNFANLMTAICGLMSYDGFDKKSTNLKTFYLGNNYKVDTKIDYDNDPEKDKYFLQQVRVDTTTFTYYEGDEKVSVPIERNITKNHHLGKGDNLHPLAPVYLVTVDNDGNKSQPTLVPAIYIKAMAHQAKVADTMQNIRIGANILALIIGIASLGSASPLILGLAALDIFVSGTDLIIISQEKKLMETDEGKAFLKNWESFSLVAAGPSVLLLGRSILIGGAKLLSKMTVANARNFVMACMIKVIIKNNITRFVQNTIEILPAAELFTISGAGHKIAETLNNLGAFFVTGKIQKGAKQEEQYAIIYKGEAIFVGAKRDLEKQIGRWSKKPQHKLGEIIDELSAYNKGTKLAKSGTGGGFKYLTEVESPRMVCQEEPMSCAAACIRQLALDEGIDISEKTIRKFAKTDKELGTILNNIGPAFKKIFERKKILAGSAFIPGIEDMKKVAETISTVMKKPWIASLKSESGITHSVIVDKIENGFVYIRDPWNKEKGFGQKFGVEATMSVENFEYFWRKTYHHYSLIK